MEDRPRHDGYVRATTARRPLGDPAASTDDPRRDERRGSNRRRLVKDQLTRRAAQLFRERGSGSRSRTSCTDS